MRVNIEETHLATFQDVDGGKKRERGSRKLGGGNIYSQETTCTSRKIFIYCKNIYSRVQSGVTRSKYVHKSAMRKVYVWKCGSKMSLCFQSPFGTVQCLFVIEKQFIAKSLSVRRHNIFETLSISKHF